MPLEKTRRGLGSILTLHCVCVFTQKTHDKKEQNDGTQLDAVRKETVPDWDLAKSLSDDNPCKYVSGKKPPSQKEYEDDGAKLAQVKVLMVLYVF